MAMLPQEMSRVAGKRVIRSYARKLAEPETIKDLNITPMMDMMTIILVFLLKSFASSTSLIQFDKDLQIPRSSSVIKTKEAIQVQITKKMVVIEGNGVVPINNGKIDSAHKPGGENGYLVAPIEGIMTKIGNREKKVADMTGNTFSSELLVIADQTTPFRLLTEVLYSCGQAGYANYRLMVIRNRGD